MNADRQTASQAGKQADLVYVTVYTYIHIYIHIRHMCLYMYVCIYLYPDWLHMCARGHDSCVATCTPARPYNSFTPLNLTPQDRWVVLQLQIPCWTPQRVRHSASKNPKFDRNFESHPTCKEKDLTPTLNPWTLNPKPLNPKPLNP